MADARHHKSPLHDLGVLVARLVLGTVMIAHGWQKYAGTGLAETQRGFAQMGIPSPRLAAGFTIGIELVGGALVIVGLLLPLVGVVYTAVLAGAMFFAHLGNGFYASEGGFEFVLVLAGLSLALACIGAGRYSVDGAVSRRWRARRARSLPATAKTT